MKRHSITEALNWMLAGKPVRREFWQDDEYLRYSEVLFVFQLWGGGEYTELPSLEIGGYDITVVDWVLGTYDPMTGAAKWPEEDE
jgi:beta-glucanase (GH16 family)